MLGQFHGFLGIDNATKPQKQSITTTPRFPASSQNLDSAVFTLLSCYTVSLEHR
jgi:hypothetical protein